MSYDTLNGFAQAVGNDNALFLNGTVQLNENNYNSVFVENSLLANVVKTVSTAGALATSGKSALVGGTGFALTLGAPTPGCLVDANLLSITSGSITITASAGTTLNGTNTIATFDTVADRLVIGYLNATTWQVFLNNGVVLS